MPSIPNPSYPSKNIKSSTIIILTLVLIAFQPADSLHIHLQVQDPKEYNQQTYYSELAGMQQRFANDLKSINDKFKGINLKLKNTNISASDQVIFLQQNLANQRDALFNIERYLNVPFALRSCQCINVTQQQKNDIQGKISEVQSSISKLQKLFKEDKNGKPYENPQCPKQKCNAVEGVNAEIAQMKNYIKIMNDTITSQCCKIVHYIYRDNLLASKSWVYGNTTEQQYRLSIFNKSANQNLTQCPETQPFASSQSNQCISCPVNTPIFDLSAKKCIQSCESRSLILIEAQHQCDYNRTCSQDKYFSQSTHKCEIALGTDSSCPKNKPIWNFKTLTCIECPEDKPYFDTNVKACRKCTQNEVWQQYIGKCLEKTQLLMNCTQGTYYNPDTQKCDTIPNQPNKNENGGTKVGANGSSNTNNLPGTQTPTSGTYSQCPPATPFWSLSDLACYKCPQSSPSYNSITNKCQQCPENKKWYADRSKCLQAPIQCSQNQTYSIDNQKCEANINCNSNQVYNSATGNCQSFSSTGQIGMCPPQSPFWNSKTLYCEKCSEATPYWNENTKKCENCPVNNEWDSNNQKCKSIIKSCPVGQIYNTTTAACQKNTCGPESPVFNYTTNSCEPCPPQTKFNPSNYICESLTPKKTNTSVCPTQNPYWNSQKLACDVCPAGQKLNAKNVCEKVVSHFGSLRVVNHQVIERHEQKMKDTHHSAEGRAVNLHHLNLFKD